MKSSITVLRSLLILCFVFFTESNINAQTHKADRLPFFMQNQMRPEKGRSVNNTASQDSNVTLIYRWGNYNCHAVSVDGNTLYFNNAGDLEIVDVTNPANPVELSKIVLPSAVYGITISGNYAYVADREDGLRIIDISNPAIPNEVGYYDTGDAREVYVSGNYAYVADFSDGLRIIDISNPANPAEVGSFDTEYYAFEVYVSGNYAFVADREDGLRVIDISNPANPAEVGHLDWGITTFAQGVYVSGNYAFVADADDGLRIIDISNPAIPAEVGSFDTGSSARGVYVSGNYAYVADGDDGLRIIDISNPAIPAEVGFFVTGTSAYGVYVSGIYAYVADTNDGLYILRNDLLTGVNDNNGNLPDAFSLRQNYPNPFNPSTTIKYSIPRSTEYYSVQHVTLKVFDILGKEVAALVNKKQKPGNYEVQFDANDLGSGVYFYRLTTNTGFVQTKKMLLLR